MNSTDPMFTDRDIDDDHHDYDPYTGDVSPLALISGAAVFLFVMVVGYWSAVGFAQAMYA